MGKMMKTEASFRGLAIGGVRADAANANAILAELQTAVQAMRSEHAEQIEALRKGQADVVKAEKVDRINADVERLQAAIDRLNVQAAAASVGAGGRRGVGDPEYTDGFRAHMRRGDVQASLNKGTAPEGGFLAPVEWDRTITDRLVVLSPMRQLAAQMTISTAGFSKLFNLGGTTSGWVGEQTARPNTNTGTFAQLSYATGELYANPAATQQMLDDAQIDLESWLAGEVESEFALREGLAFFAGDGVNKPTGILTYVTGGANASVHPFGAIQLIASGLAAALSADAIVSLIYSLPQEYQAAARFALNRNTARIIRLLKDGQGNYLWQPSFVAGQPSTVAGYPLTEAAAMPDVAANAVPILFGDFKRTYVVIDRTGVRVLRDPFTNKPFVSFYTTKRVGGGLLNPEPMRGLRIAVS